MLRDPCHHSHGFILTINGGSSNLKCALFHVGPPLARVVSCMIDQIGFLEGTLTLTDVAGGTSEHRTIQAAHHKDCVDPLIAWLEQKVANTDLVAIGFRVVQGGHRYSEPQCLTPEVIDELRRLSPCDPEHLPAEIELIETLGRRYPMLPQVACFDTAFHRDMPRVARLLPIPRRYDERLETSQSAICSGATRSTWRRSSLSIRHSTVDPPSMPYTTSVR